MAKISTKRQGTEGLPFAQNLKRLMDERDLSVRAIAAMAEVKSPSIVMSWLSKANPHDLQAVARLAKALNIGFKELLLGESEGPQVTELSAKDLFDEQDFFDGICRIKIHRLVPKKGGNK